MMNKITSLLKKSYQHKFFKEKRQGLSIYDAMQADSSQIYHPVVS
jgi:hypothetical protein